MCLNFFRESIQKILHEFLQILQNFLRTEIPSEFPPAFLPCIIPIIYPAFSLRKTPTFTMDRLRFFFSKLFPRNFYESSLRIISKVFFLRIFADAYPYVSPDIRIFFFNHSFIVKEFKQIRYTLK